MRIVASDDYTLISALSGEFDGTILCFASVHAFLAVLWADGGYDGGHRATAEWQ